MTNVAFEAFSCYEFEDGRDWLIADVSIECNTRRHHKAKGLASVAIAVYPVGLFALNAALLFRTRKDIYSGKQTTLSQATLFLHREYKKVCPGGFCFRLSNADTVLHHHSRRLVSPPCWNRSTFGGS